MLLCLVPLSSGCARMRTRTEYVPKEVVVYRYRPLPQGLLTRHCETLKLSDVVTTADMEEALVRAWTCVQDHNRDKDNLEAL
mgnify:FL=1